MSLLFPQVSGSGGTCETSVPIVIAKNPEEQLTPCEFVLDVKRLFVT